LSLGGAEVAEIPVAKGKLGVRAAAMTSLALAAWLLLMLILPLYHIEGPVEGLVSFAYYGLEYYGVPLYVYELDVVRSFSAPTAVYAAYEAFSGLYLLKAVRRRKDVELPLRLCFSGGLAGVVVGGIILGLYAYYFSRALSSLAVSLSHSTTAGLIILGSSTVRPTWYTPLLANPLAILFLSALASATSALALLMGSKGGTRASPTERHEAFATSALPSGLARDAKT